MVRSAGIGAVRSPVEVAFPFFDHLVDAIVGNLLYLRCRACAAPGENQAGMPCAASAPAAGRSPGSQPGPAWAESPPRDGCHRGYSARRRFVVSRRLHDLVIPEDHPEAAVRFGASNRALSQQSRERLLRAPRQFCAAWSNCRCVQSAASLNSSWRMTSRMPKRGYPPRRTCLMSPHTAQTAASGLIADSPRRRLAPAGR